MKTSALAGRRAFVTGVTGFKGAWLACWLHLLGVEVHGLGLAPPARGAFHDLDVAAFASTTTADIRDADTVAIAIGAAQADLVFHLAAQPLVRAGWNDRRTTFETNIIGTVNVLEAALATATVEGVVLVTTDKVYENREEQRPFVETDRLGGHDPYSASKAAAELVIEPYRRSELMGLHAARVVSARAGNVIGGGDWSADRLVPDIVRALTAGQPITLRRPDAVRPWQHVLDCVWGYLLIGAAMLEGRPLAPSYNFAHEQGAATVLDVTKAVLRHWGAPDGSVVIEREDDEKEAGFLQLDPARAQRDLGWGPAWSLERSIEETVRFYKNPSVGRSQIEDHMATVDSQTGR
jgi:CDP-glucose 4,6-dehydratase